MIPIIKAVSEMLCRENITVDDVVNVLGNYISGGEQGVPIKVRPNAPSIKDVRVVRDGESDNISHVNLLPTCPIPLSDLIATFGPYHAVRRSTHPDAPPRVRFDVRPPGMTHSAAIYASYEEGDYDTKDSMVISVMIRRD